MVAIPAGGMVLRDARTQTSRAVRLRDYAIARDPVTWEHFTRLTGSAAPDGEEPTAPVHSVSWWDAVEWCNALSIASSRTPAYAVTPDGVTWDVSADGFRLPTEAEWEWACRAGSSGPTYGPLADIAWTSHDAVTRAQPVGRKHPNAFGLADTLGNVWEWCWDYADPARYADYRLIRGGGWADPSWSVRASVRRGTMPATRIDDIGFRVAQGAVGAPDTHAAQGWSREGDRARATMDGLRPAGWTPLSL